jgi:hypothetical protein
MKVKNYFIELPFQHSVSAFKLIPSPTVEYPLFDAVDRSSTGT